MNTESPVFLTLTFQWTKSNNNSLAIFGSPNQVRSPLRIDVLRPTKEWCSEFLPRFIFANIAVECRF